MSHLPSSPARSVLRLGAVAALLVITGATLNACTSSVAPTPQSPPPPRTPNPPTTHTRSRPPSTPAPTSSSAPSSSPASSSSQAPSSSPAPSSSSAVVQPAACSDGTVNVSVREEGALPGQEIVQLRFTNSSGNPCTLTGFPGVELLRHGHVLGKPAVRSTDPIRTFVVAPGGRPVAAKLVDHSRCNAPLSDTVGVYVPNQTVQQHVALKLRGCSLTIDPVRPLHGGR